MSGFAAANQGDYVASCSRWHRDISHWHRV